MLAHGTLTQVFDRATTVQKPTPGGTVVAPKSTRFKLVSIFPQGLNQGAAEVGRTSPKLRDRYENRTPNLVQSTEIYWQLNKCLKKRNGI